MSERSQEDSQVFVPESFIALYRLPGRQKLGAPRSEIAQRHEFCDDLAQMLTEQAQTKLWELDVTEADVLERMRRGLSDEGSVLSNEEAVWVTTRLAELLGWPALPAEPSGADQKR
jgi:hypothetical protein